MTNTILVVLVLTFTLCNAQLATPGRWKPNSYQEQSGRTWVLPPLDNAELLANEDTSHGGYDFAHVFSFPINFDSWGPEAILPTGDRLWRTTLVSETALNLGVTFKGFHIPDGGELYLIGQNKTRGAFTSINNPDTEDGLLTTWPIEGSYLILEYFQPADIKALPSFDIALVAHGYKPGPLCFDCSGECNINVVCDNDWDRERRGVGMLLTASGGRFCSGSMVNNVESNGDQLFLTAAHCRAGTTSQVMFMYQSATCNPSQNGPTDNIIGGLQPLEFNDFSDYMIMRIREPIPPEWNVYLNGVSGQNVPGEPLVGIHHPRGDVKKICYSDGPATRSRWNSGEPGDWHWRIPFWALGTTEPGSSGSPLFDQNHRVVGQLHGGPASCTVINYDMFGATWASWSLGLGTYLDPSNTGNLIIDGIDLNVARANKKTF